MNRKIQIASNCILVSAGVIFILFYLFLAFNNRPADEDLVFIPVVQKMGFFEFMGWFYNHWSGRFSSTLYFLIVMSGTKVFEHIHYFFFAYSSITLLLLLYSVSSIIKNGVQKIFYVLLPTKTTLVYSILFVAGFYFSTFDHSQVWWWIFASTDTLQGITFLLLGISFLMKEKKSILHYLVIAFSFIYVGGEYEIYSLIIGSLFLFSFYYLLRVRHNKFSVLIKNNLFKGVLLASICFSIAAIISYIAPGNFARRIAHADGIVTNTGLFQNSEIVFSFSIFLQKKYLLAVALSSLWLLLGFQLRDQIVNPDTIKRLKKITLLLIIPILLSFFITWAFQMFILINDTIPPRGWTFTSFSLFCFTSFLFLTLGYSLPKLNSLLKILALVLIPAFVLTSLSIYFYREHKLVSKYIVAYDSTITLLKETKKNKDVKVLYVDPLPDSGMLMPLELEKEWITTPLKAIFDLKYEIKVKE